MEKTKFNDSDLMETYLREVMRDDLSENPYKPKTVNGVTLTTVKEWGGEAEGDSIGYVLLVEEGDQSVHVQVSGFYDSYNGSDFDLADVYLVEPREVTVTKYFRIK